MKHILILSGAFGIVALIGSSFQTINNIGPAGLLVASGIIFFRIFSVQK